MTYPSAPQPQQPPQPGNGMMKPNNFLIPNILATIFCCLPAGIVGIIMSLKVDKLYNAGDIAGAQQASKTAKLWMIASIVLGIVGGIIYGVVLALSGGDTTAVGY
ncbi:CD225/dispanin family protein [Corynebacterium argentoratense]|uniref:CD225/dispanin family protein n=1 Tax=Corynebacterium argentoratense TaxID=42817 RepID=UPI001F1B8149|nr:CD225/dispanin family protein [Corynebacterium argentoratense]MCF1765457.1 CD225/dispanin family protein [Corynebacterium argentoratense]